MPFDEPRVAWSLEAMLGEGPIWVERDSALWFTDIKRQQIHRFDPTTGDRRSWESPEQVGFVVPAQSGGFIAGLQSGLHRFYPDNGQFSLLVEVDPDRPTNRLNDAVVDPSGRLWFGTMDNSEREKCGSYYCFDRNGLRATGLTDIAITNGPAISPNGSTLYWVDTIGREMHSCEIAADGTLGPSHAFVKVAPGEGNPDGPAVDSEGCIWIGIYNGWEARRYSPAGEIVSRVRFPVSNITKIAFGGPDRKTAFATTARHLLKPERLAEQPLAGTLFAFDVEVPGLRGYEVAD